LAIPRLHLLHLRFNNFEPFFFSPPDFQFFTFEQVIFIPHLSDQHFDILQTHKKPQPYRNSRFAQSIYQSPRGYLNLSINSSVMATAVPNPTVATSTAAAFEEEDDRNNIQLSKELTRELSKHQSHVDNEEPANINEDEYNYPSPAKLAAIMTSLYVSIFLIALDRTIIGVAIPHITNEFHSIEDIGWYASLSFSRRMRHPCSGQECSSSCSKHLDCLHERTLLSLVARISFHTLFRRQKYCRNIDC
jgi:hypothetical protein